MMEMGRPHLLEQGTIDVDRGVDWTGHNIYDDSKTHGDEMDRGAPPTLETELRKGKWTVSRWMGIIWLAEW